MVVAVKRRVRVGAAAAPEQTQVVLAPSRAVVMPIGVKNLDQPLLVVSLYLEPGLGLAKANALALVAVLRYLEGSGCAYVIGGDFNTSPASVRRWLEAKRCTAIVAESGRPTCIQNAGASDIDFFACNRALAS